MGLKNRVECRTFTVDEIKRFFPVKSIEIYPGRVIRVKREAIMKSEVTPGEKTQISKLTRRSRDHLAFVACATEIEFKSMLNLTYGNYYPRDLEYSKAHLNAVLTRLRSIFDNLSYLWVMEFQTKRLAVHYHVLLSVPKPRFGGVTKVTNTWVDQLKKFMVENTTLLPSEILSECAKIRLVHQHIKNWENVRSQDGARRYMVKYCLKMEQKSIPPMYTNVGRFWGCSQDVKSSIKPLGEIEVTEEMLELIIRATREDYEPKLSPKYLFGISGEGML